MESSFGCSASGSEATKRTEKKKPKQKEKSSTHKSKQQKKGTQLIARLDLDRQ